MAEEQRELQEPRTVNHDPVKAELAYWRATSRRQAAVIEALTRVVGRLRSGLTALKAENAELRTVHAGRYRHSLDSAGATVPASIEARVGTGVHAPAAARRVITRALAFYVSPHQLECAKLAISELVADSVCHSGRAQEGYLTVRVWLTGDALRLEVEDLARDGVFASRPEDVRSAEGLRLRIVQSLSERWGVERSAGGGTRTWTELSLTASTGRATSGSGQAAPEAQQAHVETAPVCDRPGELHVIPVPRAGTWALFADSVALSEHTTETAAESAARAEALRRGCERIVVHDRYHRTRAKALAGLN
jgi:hypothetical protein